MLSLATRSMAPWQLAVLVIWDRCQQHLSAAASEPRTAHGLKKRLRGQGHTTRARSKAVERKVASWGPREAERDGRKEPTWPRD